MAREYAKIRLSRQHDDAWCDLSPGAQHLYDTLTTSEDLSYCGRVDWRPARLLPRARGWTLAQITAAAAELEAARFVLFDPDTEEALVRALIRSDELLRNPKMGISVVKAYGSLASRTLRAAVVTELRRARDEHPEYSSWANPMCAPQLERLLSLPDLESVGYTNRITNAIGDAEHAVGWSVPASVPLSVGTDTGPGEARSITNPITNEIRNGITNGISYADPVPNANADRSESPIPTQVRNTSVIGNPDRSVSYQQTADSRQQTSGGYVTGERHQANEPDSNDPPPTTLGIEPSRWCVRHPGGTTDPCRDCRTARETHDRFHAERKRDLAAAAEAKRSTIAECSLCDEAGWRIPPPQIADEAADMVARCTHEPTLPAAWRALLADMLADAESTEHEETKTDV